MENVPYFFFTNFGPFRSKIDPKGDPKSPTPKGGRPLPEPQKAELTGWGPRAHETNRRKRAPKLDENRPFLGSFLGQIWPPVDRFCHPQISPRKRKRWRCKIIHFSFVRPPPPRGRILTFLTIFDPFLTCFGVQI